MQQTITANSVSPAQFCPEYVGADRPVRQRAPQSQSSPSPDASSAPSSRARIIEATAKASAQSTVALIEAEFKNNRRFYEYKLGCAGVAWHELPDALGDLFALAVFWAKSYDPSKSGISSWLGNQVVRTVASSIYGTRRPGWRHQQEREMSAEELTNDTEHAHSEVALGSFCNASTQAEDLAVAAFLHQLSGELTTSEAAIIDICGLDLLYERQALPQLIQIRDLLDVRSLTTVRAIKLKLGSKVRALALEHFDTQDLPGRPGFDKLAA
ncbi:hypothetical protein [Caballeronia zhejiangensis]|uniref:hypothetical protein n=1 Tax=Caballeronia zhejiangensis TaxID=871203 RepID=UPI001EF4461A|nr:hypothetical protein [Caballeronia zhejiangensis]MCG7399693.1 hypothetical protein [Caballeronia zhejiangensis]